jgi:predicted TPR repeat methyltransferase
MMWSQKRLEGLIAQLERRIEEQLAELKRLDGNVTDGRQLGTSVSQLSEFVQRLDHDVGQGFAGVGNRLETDLVTMAEQIRQLGGIVSQLGEFVQRLDRDVGQGFAAVGNRLETDLVTLARTTHELVESSRYASSVLSKLAADQIQLADGARHNGAAAQSRPVPAITVPVEPPILPLEDAELPPAVRKWLAEHDTGPNQPAWYLNQKLLPQSPDTLSQLPEIMAACHRRLRPGDRLAWAQQVAQEPLLAPNELEQVLGLLGPVQGPTEVIDANKTWLVAFATRRIEAAGVVLRWSTLAMEALHVRLRPLAEEMLERSGLREAAHAVDLPEPDADMENWARLLPSLVTTVATREGVPIGVTLPARFDEAPERMGEALARLRRALREGGKQDEIAFQWVRGSVRVAKSSAVLAFAHRQEIGFDFTPVSRGARESRLAAYEDRLPYRALPFDLRLPSYGAHKVAVVEIPRWPGRFLDSSATGQPCGLGSLFQTEFDQSRRRLARVLDRAGQEQFERQANSDAALVGYWPEYFVYNWSQPAAAYLRVFEFDASDLFSAASPLNRVFRGSEIELNRPHYLSGQQLLAVAARVVQPIVNNLALKQLQIEAHEYLRENRPDITGDAARLIEWMPETLGITLELGSGFGVMARRLQHRAGHYIGLDLTFDQVAAIRELGALGLIADMQALPFADAVFDTIVADNVVEHAGDPLQALLECQRVLKPGGLAFMVIPPDYLRPEFCNPAHLWKSDETSVREALRRAGLRIVRQETIHLADLGVGGAYPSSDGQTGLWQVEKPA